MSVEKVQITERAFGELRYGAWGDGFCSVRGVGGVVGLRRCTWRGVPLGFVAELYLYRDYAKPCLVGRREVDPRSAVEWVASVIPGEPSR
jgi:hypothetical protein